MAAILGGLRRIVFKCNAFLCSIELKSTHLPATKWRIGLRQAAAAPSRRGLPHERRRLEPADQEHRPRT
jgi:hypothetical protein